MTAACATLTFSDIVAAFDLPEAAKLNQRVPKKLLLENGAPTTADRKLIQEAVEEVTWLAALKPASIGVPEYQDAQRSYLEIAVLAVALRDTAKMARLAELIHRAIPYPVVLLLTANGKLALSLAHIRWAQKETDKTVLDGETCIEELTDQGNQSDLRDFLQALSLRRQARADLFALYQGWLDTLTALQAMALTGCFSVAANAEQASARRVALRRCREVDSEVARLRAAAAKEKQMARQVAVNMEIHALLAERARVAGDL